MPRPKKSDKNKKRDEAVQDIQQDHEQFLLAFEKPTQIYRFLRARHIISPMFLHRSLLYMQERCSRTNTRRKAFAVKDFLKLVLRNQIGSTQIPSNQNEDLYIAITGVTMDPSSEKEQSSKNSVKMKRADVEIIVKKTMLNKRKDSDGTAEEISAGVVEVPVNPRKPNEVSLSTMEENEGLLVISASNFSRINVDSSCTKSISILFKVREATTESDDSEESDSEESDAENESSSEEEGRQRKRKKLSDSEGEDPAGISLKNLTTGPRKWRGRNSARKNKNEPKTDCKGEEETIKGKRKFYTYHSRKPPLLKKNANTTKLVQYEAELQTINVDQECLVRDGDYELVLNEIKPKEARDYKRKAVWESFDGGREIKVYSALSGPSLKVLFKWRPSNEQGPFSMDHSNDEQDEDLEDLDSKKRRTRNSKHSKTSASATNAEIPDNGLKLKVDRVEYLKSNSRNSKGRNGVFSSFDNSGVARVYYQFMYNNNTQQQTESREDFYCPWCQLNCMTIYGLMKHLKLCHPRFLFSYSQQPKGTRIIVMVNECYDGSYTGNPQNIFGQPGLAFSRRGPVRRIPVTDILVYRPQRATKGIDPNTSLADLLEKEDTEAMEATQYSAGHRRLYFHSPTTLPVRPCEFDIDSEGETEEPDWLFGHTKRMIDEFTDVNEGEKAIMKIWNLHVMRHNCIADIQIEEECMRFMEENVKLLVDYNLRRNLLLHFVCLVDFGVFKTSSIVSLMNHFDKVEKEYKESCSDVESGSNESKDLMSLDFPKPDLFPRIAQLEEVIKNT